uniref:Reverse transcriptase zinc-binding domain-containing protein n=1 Tax=Ananas comosus var. bracteatus TaxID=296719 RepID=A0A6V7P2A0_ANACO|nr:unnamed protein product [Ananas comosus var. bracteatus]
MSSVPYACSPIWRNMLSQAAPFLSSVDFVLGDGRETPFWRVRWCGDITLKNRFPTLYAASVNPNITVSFWTQRFANQPNMGFNPCAIHLSNWNSRSFWRCPIASIFHQLNVIRLVGDGLAREDSL